MPIMLLPPPMQITVSKLLLLNSYSATTNLAYTHGSQTACCDILEHHEAHPGESGAASRLAARLCRMLQRLLRRLGQTFLYAILNYALSRTSLQAVTKEDSAFGNISYSLLDCRDTPNLSLHLLQDYHLHS